MNRCVPDRNLDDDSRPFRDPLLVTNHKRSMGPDHELMELSWRNGHVVMPNQTHWKSPFKQAQKSEAAFRNLSNSIHEDETASWFQYSLNDPLEKEYCSSLFDEIPAADAVGTDKLKDVIAEGHRWVRFGVDEQSMALTESVSEESSLPFKDNMMPPPKSHVTGTTNQASCLGNGGLVNFQHLSRPLKAGFRSLNGRTAKKESGNGIQVELGESSSMMTSGSSNCRSNQVQNKVDLSHDLSNDETGLPERGVKEDFQRVQIDTYDTTLTSSSGGYGCSSGRTEQHGASNQCHKRKARATEEPECHSPEAGYESVPANKPDKRYAFARRNRSAVVHNLSERRRRDRINEKLRALQALIPHCNKLDKASMLDEAIDYLKSLQLQVQIMWMGGGMAPMMFPGVQNYMSHMASTASQMQMFPYQPSNPVNFPNQMQNVNLPESYARYLSFHHMRPPPQTMNLCTYGSHMVQQDQMATAVGGSCLSTNREVPPENIQNGKSG